jgi:magnesium transporter
MQPLPPPNRASSSGNQAHEHQQSKNTPPPHPPPASSAADTFAQGASVLPSHPDSKKKRKHRGGKRKKNRRQSFAVPSEASGITSGNEAPSDPLVQVPEHDVAMPNRGANSDFYAQARNFSDESLDSEILLDHREQPAMRPRRDSRLMPSLFTNVARSPGRSAPVVQSPSVMSKPEPRRRLRSRQTHDSSDDDDDRADPTDRTPLMRGLSGHKSSPTQAGYGLFRSHSHASSRSSASRKVRRSKNTTGSSFPKFVDDGYDVNNPPSVPPSPGLDAHPDDVMVTNGDFLPRSPDSRRNLPASAKDALIDIDGDATGNHDANSAPPSPRLRPEGLQRHRAMTLAAEGDVCFPGDEMSEIADDDLGRIRSSVSRPGRRRRRREWPQLWPLDEWSREEKEVRDGERRAKKTNEPVLVEGRLRPSKHYWHRDEEAAPYRFTYFCEEFESTIHAQTISELVQPGGSFRELFIPDPPELEDSSESEDETTLPEMNTRSTVEPGLLSPRSMQASNPVSRVTSLLTDPTKPATGSGSKDNSGKSSGRGTPLQNPGKAKKYGPRPTFWLDVLSPSDQEMRVLCKTFGIHALTSEDIMMQEAREKVELFRNYYFINYRTFEQDPSSEDYLEPVNMYVCVFRHGIVTFHFSQIPHPANVRRRIRQLTDYLILSADWISYAIIDDITDVYQPLITNIEEEVDEIDDLILNAYQETDELKNTGPAPSLAKNLDSSKSNADEEQPSGIDMLRRIGECRKKVMSLYRLLGQKADVIKGFAKRCNEQWEVAPKSEIGLYLGDIQDHIITMSSNLSHYETLLSRAHSNYLAQVNIRMNERSEKTADILGKLTVSLSPYP